MKVQAHQKTIDDIFGAETTINSSLALSAIYFSFPQLITFQILAEIRENFPVLKMTLDFFKPQGLKTVVHSIVHSL